jgi:predicted DNA-binding protein (MmcQ/YjbR family)
MNIEDFRDYCIAKKGVTEETPFGPDTLVFKVMGKVFAICGIDEFEFINLKCDPDRAIELRESYTGIRPGWHMNKKSWNSVYTNDDVQDPLIYELTDHSYELVVASLTKKMQGELAEL